MPVRIPVQRVGVSRAKTADKKGRIRATYPEIGKPFDFTTEEIERINKISPGALKKPTREVEDDELFSELGEDDEGGDDAERGAQGGKSEGPQVKTAGGTKKSNAAAKKLAEANAKKPTPDDEDISGL